MSHLVDLSHTIEHGMLTFKGLPAPIICDYLGREESRNRYEEGTEFQIGKIEMVSNTGTYIDSPFHRYAHGKDLSEVALQRFTNLEGVLVRAHFNQGIQIDKNVFEKTDVRGKAVLVNTSWSDFWRTEKYFENHSFLTASAATYLRDQGVTLVGIDSHNIDDTRGNSRPVHSILLAAEILIVEHMVNLEQLPDAVFTFHAVPPKIKGVGTFPVRAYAEIK